MKPHPYLASVLDETAAYVRRYIVVDDDQLAACALWNAHTYVYDAVPATPYLHAFSPEPGSGKTTLLDVLASIGKDAIQADNLTEAVLFRLIDDQKPTLLFDEVDAVFGKKNSDSAEGIRSVLNSGYRRGKKAYRCVPPRQEVIGFDVYCPKATAGLVELPGTLAHRSIPIEMQPPLPDDLYEEFDPEDAEPAAEILRANLQAWADESLLLLADRALRPEKLPDLDARGNEIWRILFRIANQAGGIWPEQARTVAGVLSGGLQQRGNMSARLRLLAHIRELFDGDRMSCQAVVDALNADDDLPYGGWNDGKGISTRELGQKIGPLHVKANTIRMDDKRVKGYRRDWLEPAWARYLGPLEPPTPYIGLYKRDKVTTRTVEPKTDPSTRVTNAVVPLVEKGANPHEQRVVTHVPLVKADIGPEGEETALERAREFDELFPPKGSQAPVEVEIDTGRELGTLDLDGLLGEAP